MEEKEWTKEVWEGMVMEWSGSERMEKEWLDLKKQWEGMRYYRVSWINNEEN